MTRQTLAGLRGVSVLVERISDAAQRDGLLADQIQTDVEVKLRQAGIPVLTSAESSTDSPYLYVNPQLFKNTVGLYVYNLEVRLDQAVSLRRQPSISTTAPTWSATAQYGTVAPAALGSVRDRIRDLTDQFINAYLAANPKR